jgi:hypothetical protein
MNHDCEDDHEGDDDGYAPAADPVLIAFTLIDLALNPKAAKAGLKQLVKLDKSIAAAEQKLAALTAQAEQTQAALAARAAELDQRERAITERENEFTASIEEARAHLRGYYDSVAEADRHLRYRVLNHADLLHGYNSQLQQLPDWPAIRRLVVGLPPDPPPLEREVAAHPRIDVFSDVSNDPGADRHGAPFLGELTRDVSHHKRRGAE